MNVVHLAASPFFGGPERQILGLATHLPRAWRNVFLSFAEGGASRPFLDRAAACGFETVTLRENWPHFLRAAREIADHLKRTRADILLCNGYKSDLLGWRAARKVGIPVIAVAHGWTGATWKVRLNETLDAWVMRWLDAVVGVSAAMTEKVRRAGVPAAKVVTIRNAVQTEAFDVPPDPSARRELEALFPKPPARIVLAAGRLSPEKGFEVLIDAAARVLPAHAEASFVVFGDGPLREDLTRRIAAHGLQGSFVLGGFRSDLERLLPHADVAVLSSHTEGLPVAVLEAQAAGVPVVATAVGGTPEVVAEGETGFLVPPANPEALAARIGELLRDDEKRRRLGECGRLRVRAEFSFARQAAEYQALFARLTGRTSRRGTTPREEAVTS